MLPTLLPTGFHAGLAALLTAFAVLALARSRAGRAGEARAHPSVLLQLGLAVGVLWWAGATLSQIADDHDPGLEVRGYSLAPPSAGPPVLSLGTSDEADVPIADRYADDVHLVVRWLDGASGPEPWIWNASSRRRVELDGKEVHDTDLVEGTDLSWDGPAMTVQPDGRWPGVHLVAADGDAIDAAAPVARGLLSMVPIIGPRMNTRLGFLVRADDGRLALQERRPLPGTGPTAELRLQGTTPRLGFSSADDRARHPIVVTPPGGQTRRPADRPTRLREGQLLTVGYSRFVVSLHPGGRVELRAVGHPARMEWPGDDAAVLGTEPGVLAVGRADGRALTLASLDPDGAHGFRRTGGSYVVGDGARDRVSVQAGEQVLVPVADGARVRLRVTARGGALASLQGLGSAADGLAWRSFVALAVLYLLLVIGATRAGLLHARSAGVLHGAAVLFALGLICLYRLSDPDDLRRAGWVLRQSQLGVLGVAVACAVTWASAWRTARIAPRPARLFRWLERGHRVRWLYLLALGALALQLPFGEAGIALPGLGSVQPIELARTLLVVYLAYWTARAIEDKRDRLRGTEGLRQRWSYMVHALPVLAVLGLCYGLDDISPILVFVAFLAVLYGASLVRPSLRLWPPRAWRDHLAVDLVAVLVLLGGVAWLVLGDPSGTVAGRLRTWWDPWSNSAEAYQAVTALWATASGGLFGLGWTGPNGVLPPAVQDDFIVALLAARGGVVAVGLMAATFAVILLSGVASLRNPSAVASADGDRERATLMAGAVLWMLALQAGVVLGSATGGLPVMGQPLPFVAAAGSHLLLFCIPAVGLVLGATRVRVPVRRPRRHTTAAPLAWDLDGASLAHATMTEGGG